MKLYYYKDAHGNYGDDINSWLWPQLAPNFFKAADDKLFCGIGTILNRDIPKLPKKKIVFGSGVGYGLLPEGFGNENWKVISVRGPLSAKILNLPENLAVTDGAILIAALPEFEPLPESARQGIVFMPHHENALKYGQWQSVCRKAGISFIDPRENSLQITQTIRTAKLVIAEAMHAAIVADTLRVPWIPVAISCNVNHFKWLDWTLSLNLSYQPRILPPSTLWETWQNIRMKMAEEGHSFRDLTADNAVANMIKRLKTPPSSEWTKGKLRSETLDRRLGKLMRLPGLDYFFHLVDTLYMRRAVWALKGIVQTKISYLSTQAIYQERLDEMKKLLQEHFC